MNYDANILVCFSASWYPPCKTMEGTILTLTSLRLTLTLYAPNTLLAG